jgi:hypothetical protein
MGIKNKEGKIAAERQERRIKKKPLGLEGGDG